MAGDQSGRFMPLRAAPPVLATRGDGASNT